MTTEELLELPDDGVRRELIRGELREYTGKPCLHCPDHAHAMAQFAYLFESWRREQPAPRGRVYASFQADQDSDPVDVDLAYLPPALAPDEAGAVYGVPTLAVEILEPSDRHGAIAMKVDRCLQAGVPLVWVVDPHFETIQVYRPDAEPELFHIKQTLSADPHLPGFTLAVADLFAE